MNFFAGRDLTKNKEGGAWLAFSKTGKIGMLTNFRHTSDMDQTKADASLSPRGHILVNYLTGENDPSVIVDEVLNGQKKYSLFNLLIGKFSSGSGFQMFYGSNALKCSNESYEIEPGVSS